MPTWNEKDLGRILTATDEYMTDAHYEARLTLVEDSMEELKQMFKEHIKHEEQSFVSINSSIQSLASELHETNAMIREGAITQNSNLHECSHNLRKEIMKEIYSEFEKKSDKHNTDCDKIWASIRNTNDEVAANKLKLVSLWDNHELTKKIQYAVAIAVVMAVLKATGVV